MGRWSVQRLEPLTTFARHNRLSQLILLTPGQAELFALGHPVRWFDSNNEKETRRRGKWQRKQMDKQVHAIVVALPSKSPNPDNIFSQFSRNARPKAAPASLSRLKPVWGIITCQKRRLSSLQKIVCHNFFLSRVIVYLWTWLRTYELFYLWVKWPICY